jgi:hypothetical protein
LILLLSKAVVDFRCDFGVEQSKPCVLRVGAGGPLLSHYDNATRNMHKNAHKQVAKKPPIPKQRPEGNKNPSGQGQRVDEPVIEEVIFNWHQILKKSRKST